MARHIGQLATAFAAGCVASALIFSSQMRSPVESPQRLVAASAAVAAIEDLALDSCESELLLAQDSRSPKPHSNAQDSLPRKKPDASASGAPARADKDSLRQPTSPDTQDHIDLDLSKPLSQEVLAQVVQVASEIEPQLGKRLSQLCSDQPEALDKTLRQGQFGRKLLAMAQLKQTDVELYNTKLTELSYDMQVRRVASDLREAMSGGDANRIKMLDAQLHNLLKIQLALSLKARGDYLKRLEDHIRAVRDEIDQQARNMNEIIEARFAKLIAEPQQQSSPEDSALLPAAKSAVTPQR